MNIRFIILILFVLLTSIAADAQLHTKQEKGYFNITHVAELQFLRSIDSSNVNGGSGFVNGIGYEFNTINGMFINPHLSIGLGIGIQTASYKVFFPENANAEIAARYGDGNRLKMTLLPIFADFRYYFKNLSNSFSLLLDAGYTPVLRASYKEDKSDLDGGAFVKFGAAYKIYLGNTVSLVPSLNLKAQRFGDNTAVGLTVGAGLMF